MTVAKQKAIREILEGCPPDDELAVADFDLGTVESCVELIEGAVKSYLRDHVSQKTANFVVDAANKAATIRLKLGQSDADREVGTFLRSLLDVPAPPAVDEKDTVDAEYRLLAAHSSEAVVQDGVQDSNHGPLDGQADKVAAK